MSCPRPYPRENIELHWVTGLSTVGTVINASTNVLEHPSTIFSFRQISFYSR